MLKIGITGNIASGKSLFENCLKNAGYKVLCLDFVTAFLYENSPVLKDFLLKKFNTIDKAQIAKIVFSNQLLKKELENFIYPLIMDEMNKFFTVSGIPIASSQYWNSIHGWAPGEANQDAEGLQTMRTLARNMTFLMKSIALGKEAFGLPEKESPQRTDFIR